MTEIHKVSFNTSKTVRYKPEFATVNCEKLWLADIDNDQSNEIIVIRNHTSGDKSIGEIVIYDQNLQLKASDSWNGSMMDVVVADINCDGLMEIIIVGEVKRPIVRVYGYNENYKGSLSLLAQESWESPEGLFGVAKAIHVDGERLEIAVLSIIEGSGTNKGYAQLRLYDAEMNLKGVAKWTPLGGNVVKWGHCITSADIDGDGKKELVTLVNFDHDHTKKSDIRAFDHNLLLKRRCEALDSEPMFATSMSAGDINGDDLSEIVITGGTFTGKWEGATNQIMTFDGELNPQEKTTWKTFRHSWVWDMQIADIDGDGNQEIITYGGTSMTGRNQEEANIMGEICLWDGKSLTTKDMFIWQSRPGEDTRPSRGFVFRDGDHAQFVTATSKWSERQSVDELELRTLIYKPIPNAMELQSGFIRACNEKDVDALEPFAVPDESSFTPVALEALGQCEHDRAVNLIGRYLQSKDQWLFLRAVGYLRLIGQRAEEQLRKAGFAVKYDWAIVSPFDNTDRRGFEAKYPPEAVIDFDAFYAGKDRIVRWGRIEENEWDKRWDIYTNLSYLHYNSFERTGIELFWNNMRTDSVAYALTYAHIPAHTQALLKIGFSGSIKVWLDDELKYSNSEIKRMKLDQVVIPVTMSQGKHAVMLKIANYEIDDWGFYFRITDTEGNPIEGVRYELPEVSHIHNQMLTCKQLISLLESDDERIRYLSASQLADSGDKRGNEALVSLLNSDDMSIQADSALALTLSGDKRGVDILVKLTPNRNPLFQFSAGYALKHIKDSRADRFSIDSLTDGSGDKLVEIKITDRDGGFNLSPLFKGEETSHVLVRADLQFHLGDNISARCASIRSFGIREPKYRGIGMGGLALRRACGVMAERGHTCSIVSTGMRLVAHRLYCQNGYVDRRFQGVYEKSLTDDDKNETAESIVARGYNDADKAEVLSIREQYCLNTIGTTDWSPRSSFDERIRVVEAKGKIIGYADVYIDPFEPESNINVFHVDLNFQDRDKASEILLSGINRYALDEGKKRVTFHYPPFCYRDALIRTGYKTQPSTIRQNWIGMFKVIDLPKFLREVSGLLSLCLNRSVHAGWRGSIALKGERLKATIVIDSNGNVDIDNNAHENADILVTLDDRTLTGLVSGNGDVWELYRQNMLTTRPAFNERIRLLIQSLFPMMWWRQGGWW